MSWLTSNDPIPGDAVSCNAIEHVTEEEFEL